MHAQHSDMKEKEMWKNEPKERKKEKLKNKREKNI